MKTLTCEMCGSTDIIKEDGIYVCQACGTKYSVEEAKKMMIEGTVEIQGTVKIDNSTEISNLYELARRALKTNSVEDAAKYYEQLLIKEPNSWEANFYTAYFKAYGCNYRNIYNYGHTFISNLSIAIPLVKDSIPNDEQGAVLNEIFNRCSTLAKSYKESVYNFFMSLKPNERNNRIINEVTDYFMTAINIMYKFGDSIEDDFGSEYETIYTESWKIGNELARECLLTKDDTVKRYLEKAKRFEPSPSLPKRQGCYVATAVYGSYNCPQVWTLRRFRDYTLAETWYGRIFIKFYYAISPSLVKWFGNFSWFKKMWRGYLDSMVKKLNEQGIKNTPYH